LKGELLSSDEPHTPGQELLIEDLKIKLRKTKLLLSKNKMFFFNTVSLKDKNEKIETFC